MRVVGVTVRQLGVGEEPLDPRGGRGGGLVVGLCRGRRDPADRRVDRGAGPGGEDAPEGEDAAEAGEAEGPAAGAARRVDLFFFWGGGRKEEREREEVRREEKREALREGEKAFWPRWSACQAQAPSPAETPKRIDHLKTTPRDRLLLFLLPITCPRDRTNSFDKLSRAIIGTEGSWSTGRDRGKSNQNFAALTAKISSVTKIITRRRLFCSLLLPAHCRCHRGAQNQAASLARLLSKSLLARGHAE